ncbi:hypothetical protein, partial [Oscillatoria sp. HE19RPO]|uniref:hypothetical protein n=1 Tax=Oscillatoria sp. HE19RPO TaxID=2954806 RepID=UPI0020C33B7A
MSKVCKNPQAVRVAFRKESLGLYGRSPPARAKTKICKNPQAEAWGYTDEAVPARAKTKNRLLPTGFGITTSVV